MTTILPGGGELTLTMRDIDIENTERLRKMKGISVLHKPCQISDVLNELNGKHSTQ
jgi:flavoprotein